MSAKTKKDDIKIHMQDVHKSFAGKVVLDGVNLEIKTGHSMVIIGGSGTGKSVTLKSVLGLIRPDSGSIMVDGTETVGMDARQRAHMMRKIGMLFQGAALFDSLTIWENIAFGLMNAHNMGKVDARKTALKKMDSVGLAARVADLYPAELSGGMQKRVGLARAVAADPEIIFFDEPTTGLDPIMADVINDLIVACVKDLGATTLSITHDMASARKIADDVAMIYEGRIIWNGPVTKLDKSGNDYVDQFIHGRADGPITRAA